MAAHPIGPGSGSPPSQWYAGSSTWNRSNRAAGLRAALIALALLLILVGLLVF